MAWADSEVVSLAKSFVPAADEVDRLEALSGTTGDFYRRIKT